MKVSKYLFLILACIIWIIGLSPSLYSKIVSLGFIEDGYQYGDLYRLSNLSAFRDPREQCTDYVPPTKASAGKKVHLYTIGDSFTEKQRIGKQDFVVDSYTYVKWDNFLHIKLDTTETNILLLESVERHFRQKMATPIRTLIADTATFEAKYEEARVMQKLDNAFKASLTHDRLDGLLFQNEIFLTLKQWKADFNRAVFGRVNNSVTAVNGGRDLVYYMDTDTTITSSFYELSQSEVDTIVTNVNKSADFADSLGFNQVILSIIPNKVSVLDPEYQHYNGLIERVYHHPRLQVPHIDVLADYRKMGRAAYLRGDSHWTCDGRALWLNRVNTLINMLVAPD
ncbi:hypothetical protein [Dyadobacter arcticus]|uniref:AlgX/AlgJ SGNH hydrolase-like domain-containing protein n=1 Tax=Dyadobacter arcticus TaxID=1078754 RepID=A0ABX0UGE2_9BACT|nr:hypothetical protein [Dyadobacter arcticus]NIJ52067.1 hypothetical protein [Dyadobacter arcticus]